MKKITFEMWGKNYKEYKKSNKKLSFDEWWLITGLIDKEMDYFDAQINDLKDSLKDYRKWLKEAKSETEKEWASDNIKSTQQEIKEARQSIKQLEKLCKILNY